MANHGHFLSFDVRMFDVCPNFCSSLALEDLQGCRVSATRTWFCRELHENLESSSDDDRKIG
ncbi:uncharacterized protein G2W53_020033 [Senna tora]|uniref:Uncharacterized protein n=1 Tax=Senna tora TaxID=362788 RepID=A0A834U2T0_9FABA|nr:uncharacterized protein G2W53_020033 [Senna tora]